MNDFDCPCSFTMITIITMKWKKVEQYDGRQNLHENIKGKF